MDILQKQVWPQTTITKRIRRQISSSDDPEKKALDAVVGTVQTVVVGVAVFDFVLNLFL